MLFFLSFLLLKKNRNIEIDNDHDDVTLKSKMRVSRVTITFKKETRLIILCACNKVSFFFEKMKQEKTSQNTKLNMFMQKQ